MSALPRLTRTTPKPAVRQIHFGPGAFFRGFNAVYTHELAQETGDLWGVLAVSLRSRGAADQLVDQGCAFTSVTLAPEGPRYAVIESIADVVVASDDPAGLIEAMADAAVSLVSLTVTEKGYCYHPATGRLDTAQADIIHDLAQPDQPKSALGFLVAGLARRRALELPPFTVLSCDNLPSNGALTRTLVLEFARLLDPSLAAWIDEQGRFPSTMVDRITPATTPELIEQVAKECGVRDQACVQHEPFKQWVIEDDFVGGSRPAWERVGARIVKSVEAHEHMKLRCLNGTHSALAYLGYLAGKDTIAEATADPAFSGLVQRMWDEEIKPTLETPQGEDLDAYCAALMARYQNPSIQHRTWQIAMDGSQKLPQRILGVMAENLAAERGIGLQSLAVAAWMIYVSGTDEKGQDIDVRDPKADRLREAARSENAVQSLLAMDDIFPAGLARTPPFSDAVQTAYSALKEQGAQRTVEAHAVG